MYLDLNSKKTAENYLEKAIGLDKKNLKARINLEMAATDEMQAIAMNLCPYSCCIVPEKRQELTTEGGLDVVQK